MIQIISLNDKLKNTFLDNKDIKVTTFSDYQSFDMYDINIVNLNSTEIWKCNDSQINGLNIKDDLIPLKQSINSSNTKTIIVMPMNHVFCYNKPYYSDKFNNYKKLKSLSLLITKLLKDYICDEILEYTYDKCKTTINNFIFNSDFYFSNIDKEKVLLFSDNGNKVNTYISNNVVITTINLFEFEEKNAYEKLNAYISAVYKSENKELSPSWMDEIKFFDDKLYLDNIEKAKKKIEKLEN